jgi:protein-disulfide isomerase
MSLKSLAIALFTTVVAAGAGAAETPADFDKAVHDYLLGHPEVLREMNQKLQEQDAAQRQKQMKAALTEVRDGLIAAVGEPAIGAVDADVTIVEFFDTECPFCKRIAPDLDRLAQADPHVRIVFRDFPILGVGSVIAAKAALASIQQNRYAEFHRALMADTTPEHQLDEKRVFAIAEALPLDLAKLKADMAPALDQRIAANRALAAKLAITGTPGLIFLGRTPDDDYISPGVMSFEAMTARLALMRHIAPIAAK